MEKNSIENLLNETDEQKINSELEKVISEKSVEKLHVIKENSENILAHETYERIRFEERNYVLWKEPLDLLELFLLKTIEIGNEFNKKYRPEAAKNSDYVFEALSRLHGRACQVGHEILTLLKSGYADGANARWRTLYEISVISLYIKNNGNSIAEKYLFYDYIESYKSINEYLQHPELYKKHKKILGDALLSPDEMESIKKKKDELCNRFGKEYYNQYGWAITKEKGKKFKDLENEVGIDHIRPYYNMANISIHAGPKGILFSLGSLNKKLIPAGPSNMGLADPGMNTVISLLNMNVALLNTRIELDHIITLNALCLLSDEVKTAFAKCHEITQNEYERRKKEIENSLDDNHISD